MSTKPSVTSLLVLNSFSTFFYSCSHAECDDCLQTNLKKKAKKTSIICENYSLNNSVFRQQKPLTETESKGCDGPLKMNKKRERYIGNN